MPQKRWPVAGCVLAEAFERVADPTLWDAWQAGREYVGPYPPQLALLNDGAGSPDGLYFPPLSPERRKELEHHAALGEQASEAWAEMAKQFREMLQAGRRATAGRIGNPLAELKSLEPDGWRYLDPFGEMDRSIARGPDGLRIYDVRVYAHPFAAADVAPAAVVAKSPGPTLRRAGPVQGRKAVAAIDRFGTHPRPEQIKQAEEQAYEKIRTIIDRSVNPKTGQDVKTHTLTEMKELWVQSCHAPHSTCIPNLTENALERAFGRACAERPSDSAWHKRGPISKR